MVCFRLADFGGNGWIVRRGWVWGWVMDGLTPEGVSYRVMIGYCEGGLVWGWVMDGLTPEGVSYRVDDWILRRRVGLGLCYGRPHP